MTSRHRGRRTAR